MNRNLFRSIPLMIALLWLPAQVQAAADRQVTIPAGTLLHLRMGNAVGSDISRVEQPVRAAVARPVVVRGRTALPVGSIAVGHVAAVRPAGHLKQRGLVTLRFTELQPRGEEEQFRIRTRSWSAVGPSLAKRDVEGLGIPAVGGAVIGGLVGGAKGAGIGAAAGAGAGAGRLMVTRGKNVRVPRGSVITVRLTEPVSIVVATRTAER
jgi:hypothetical protein